MTDFASQLQEAVGSAYRIERELPLGGLGRMFLATEVATGRQVSVQALPPDLAQRLDLGRFRAAADRVSRLRHPGILPLLAAGARDAIVFCVWPHPRGESLRYRLVRDGGLGGDDTVQVLHDVSDALAYGHDHGVHHGDLRPDNIYFNNGRAVVTEFGTRSALNAALGSGSAMDARADVHALAVAGQQMVTGREGPVTAVLRRALSIDPSEQFAGAAAFRDALGRPPSARRIQKRWQLGVLAALLAVGVFVLWRYGTARGPLDANLVAVAPFEVLDPEYAVWGEGLVTVLAANLDGAGPLRTVSPSVVIRGWEGRADVASALELARRTGARLIIVGRVVRTGRDSMELVGRVVDAEAGGTIFERRVSDPEARLDRLADRLTVELLEELSRSRAITAVRSASLGTASLPALKEFLEGEQHYRRSEWDRAIESYQRAIERDTAFALALYRAGLVLGWQRTSGDSLSAEYLRRAAWHNRGLPARDSMLVVAESLTAALDGEPGHPRYWTLYRRLYATTAEAVRRYPRDPEVWYEYGDVRYHHPVFSSLAEMRDAFDRSIGLDSAFAPAYIHPVELAAQLGDVAGARRYVDRYLALQPRDIFADAMRLTAQLLDHRQARGAAVQAVLDTASNDLLIATVGSFRGWADSLETWVRIARQLMAGRRGTIAAHTDLVTNLPQLGRALAYHGHLREAWEQTGRFVNSVMTATAFIGGVPAESAGVRLRRSLREDALTQTALAVTAAPWFAQQRDTAALRLLAQRGDSLARAAAGPGERSLGGYIGQGARALAALARADTAAAIGGLTALADTACTGCVLYPVLLAQLLDARRLDDEAARLLERDSPGFIYPTDGLWELYRARLAVRRGQRREAAAHYRFVRDVWLNADENLQVFVREAKAFLARANERD